MFDVGWPGLWSDGGLQVASRIVASEPYETFTGKCVVFVCSILISSSLFFQTEQLKSQELKLLSLQRELECLLDKSQGKGCSMNRSYQKALAQQENYLQYEVMQWMIFY